MLTTDVHRGTRAAISHRTSLVPGMYHSSTSIPGKDHASKYGLVFDLSMSRSIA